MTLSMILDIRFFNARMGKHSYRVNRILKVREIAQGVQLTWVMPADWMTPHVAELYFDGTLKIYRGYSRHFRGRGRIIFQDLLTKYYETETGLTSSTAEYNIYRRRPATAQAAHRVARQTSPSGTFARHIENNFGRLG